MKNHPLRDLSKRPPGVTLSHPLRVRARDGGNFPEAKQ
jgi:hypothetical protein